ncbi:uncharacterized protein LOC116604603 [Nematostella vectensis]|uniref:uncharacterized protein LOC116604603 n=1 Tax=Nematostella vectensis TaxID=45351 RepID=UPI002076DCF3|nr:uncharacterized protein LOC116604603 [Nematostella vectensis]
MKKHNSSRFLFVVISFFFTQKIAKGSTYYEVQNFHVLLDESPRYVIRVKDLLQCTLECTRSVNCLHVNFGVISHECQIFDKTIRLMVLPSKEFHYLKVMRSPCAQNPCKNATECIDLAGMEFKCACAKQQAGRLCQYNVIHHWVLTDDREQGMSLVNGPTFLEGRTPGTKAIAFKNPPYPCYAELKTVQHYFVSFSIACWLRLNSNSDIQVIFGDTGKPNRAFSLFAKKGPYLVFTRNSLDSSPRFRVQSRLLPIGRWCHVAVTWDQVNGIARVYVDAEESGRQSFNVTKSWYAASKDGYRIGCYGYSAESQLDGSMADLYIIEGALNRHDLNALMGS